MAACGPVVEIDGMVSVQIGTCRNGIRVLRPERADVVGGVKAERVRVLSQAVQVGVVGKLSSKTEVLGLEHDACCRSIEKNLTRVGTGDREREWRCLVVELDIGLEGLSSFVCPGAR